MARCGYIEGRICDIEGFDGTIKFHGQDVRSDKRIPGSYAYMRAAPDDWTVAKWTEQRFKRSFPGYDIDVLMSDGTVASGNTKLRTVRESYPDNV